MRLMAAEEIVSALSERGAQGGAARFPCSIVVKH